MYKSLTDVVRQNNRVTNVDIIPSERSVYYEGRNSVSHCVVGNDSDYDIIVDILEKKLVDRNNIDYTSVRSYKTKWINDFDLARHLAKKYNGTFTDKFFASVYDVAWEGSMKSLAVDAGFPIKCGSHYCSEDKKHRIFISGWRGNYIISVYKLGNTDNDYYEESNEEMNSIYDELNKINDEESLSEKYNVKNAKELKESSARDTLKSAFPELDFFSSF